jgi:hypothetical protein
MKGSLLFLALVMIASINNPAKSRIPDSKAKAKSVSQSDTLVLKSQINRFNKKYEVLIKELSDSVTKYKPEDNDFSDLTRGLEKSYKECTDEMDKVLLGYKLAANYYIHFDSSKKYEYREKAEPLFCSFVKYKNGEVASLYLKLDINKVHYIDKEWNRFSEQDKKTILLYGLLRGFGYGLPEVLKNAE